MAAVLWCGGEDIDYPNGASVTVQTSSTAHNPTYSRAGIYNAGLNSTSARSLSFVGGAVTSCWIHATIEMVAIASSLYLGLGLNSAAQIALAFGASSSSGTKLALWKYSGGTWTQLATETGNSLVSSTLAQFDMEVTSFGSSATVDVYINGTLAISYSGSTVVTGVTNLDCVAIPGGSNAAYTSEVIVTDTLDTRAMRLFTLAPNAAGDNNAWTGSYSNINPTTINDASVITVNTTGAEFDAKVLSLPAGSFSCAGVKVVARAEVTAGAVPTGIKLGTRESGTTYLDGGRSITNAFAPYERLMTTDPATSAAWTTATLGSLQLALESQ